MRAVARRRAPSCRLCDDCRVQTVPDLIRASQCARRAKRGGNMLVGHVRRAIDRLATVIPRYGMSVAVTVTLALSFAPAASALASTVRSRADSRSLSFVSLRAGANFLAGRSRIARAPEIAIMPVALSDDWMLVRRAMSTPLC